MDVWMLVFDEEVMEEDGNLSYTFFQEKKGSF